MFNILHCMNFKIYLKINFNSDFFFFVSPFNSDRSFLVANAQSDTFHIIFCSDGFCKMTGFTRAEVMQRSSLTEFIHGPMTSPVAVELIKEALIQGQEKHFEILYYRKNGIICVHLEKIINIYRFFLNFAISRRKISLFGSDSANTFWNRWYIIIYN